MKKKLRIADRIRAAFKPGEEYVTLYELASRVFPYDQYPNAWRYASHGGPHGWIMPLKAALRRMGLKCVWKPGTANYSSRVYAPLDLFKGKP